jgi:glucose/arabinose dehydrogenase
MRGPWGHVARAARLGAVTARGASQRPPAVRRVGRWRHALTRLGTAALVAGLAGCTFGPPPPDASGAPPRFTPSATPTPGAEGQAAIETVARHLAVPWGITFLPDGSALVTERDSGRILKVGPDRAGDRMLRVTPVQTVAAARSGGSGGLLGIAASPRYGRDRTLFVYYTTATDARIARLVLGRTPVPIVTGIPLGSGHDGGQLAFGPDGYLYAGTGSGDTAQPRTSLAGKILRMTTTGHPAPGNPVAGSLVWSSGHRDVAGLAWSRRGTLYATDSGHARLDEVNVIERGHDYGWPAGENAAAGGGTAPLLTWPPAEAGCAGAAVVGNTLVVACLTGHRLYLTQLTGRGGILGAPRAALADRYGRLRSLAVAPDGTLWVTTSNREEGATPQADDDRILRIVLPDSGGAGIT